MNVRGWSVPLVFLLLAGCGSVISKQIRQEAVPVKGVLQIREDPAAYQGKTVILGGDIIETRNDTGTTTLLVLDKTLDYRGEPEESDRSQGRFMAEVTGYLDPAVFSVGRSVTVAGVVAGIQMEPVGKTEYPYVVLRAREVHLWQVPRYPPYPPYPPWGFYYGPPYWYDPFWGPDPWWWDRPRLGREGEREHGERGEMQRGEREESEPGERKGE